MGVENKSRQRIAANEKRQGIIILIFENRIFVSREIQNEQACQVLK